MCYNQTMSTIFFLFGLLTTIHSSNSKILRKNYVPFITGFYTIMELSQSIEYFVVNECDSIWNKWLSELAYVLVLVQPLLFHTIGYLRNTKEEDKKVFKVSISMFMVWIGLNIYTRLFTIDTDSSIEKWSYLYSNQTCILRFSPTSHIYWQWAAKNLYDYHPNFFSYLLIWFIPPFFVKKECFTNCVVFLSFIVGTLFTVLSGRWEEHAAIWCFVSIPTSIALYIAKNYTHIRVKSE